MAEDYKVIKNGLKSLLTATKNAITGKDQTVSKEVKEARMSICAGCPELMKTTKQCSVCFCFVDLKTSLKQEECPMKKWGKKED